MPETRKINIAIDGYSSCGKGTLARYLAEQTGYDFIDSGAMYRAITWHALSNNIDCSDSEAVTALLPSMHMEMHKGESGKFRISINNKDITSELRSMEVADAVSLVAKVHSVRSYLVNQQRAIGANKGVVMDGRDIGTVVFPEAELKIFMTARPEIRAERRLMELKASGVSATYTEVLSNLNKRDAIDSTREDSPLTLTNAYRVLDNSDLTFDEQNNLAMGWVHEALGQL